MASKEIIRKEIPLPAECSVPDLLKQLNEFMEVAAKKKMKTTAVYIDTDISPCGTIVKNKLSLWGYK